MGSSSRRPEDARKTVLIARLAETEHQSSGCLEESVRGVVDRGEFLLCGRSPGHSALAFFAAVLTRLCRDKVMRTANVIKETTYRRDLYSLHFHFDWVR